MLNGVVAGAELPKVRRTPSCLIDRVFPTTRKSKTERLFVLSSPGSCSRLGAPKTILSPSPVTSSASTNRVFLLFEKGLDLSLDT